MNQPLTFLSCFFSHSNFNKIRYAVQTNSWYIITWEKGTSSSIVCNKPNRNAPLSQVWNHRKTFWQQVHICIYIFSSFTLVSAIQLHLWHFDLACHLVGQQYYSNVLILLLTICRIWTEALCPWWQYLWLVRWVWSPLLVFDGPFPGAVWALSFFAMKAIPIARVSSTMGGYVFTSVRLFTGEMVPDPLARGHAGGLSGLWEFWWYVWTDHLCQRALTLMLHVNRPSVWTSPYPDVTCEQAICVNEPLPWSYMWTDHLCE